MWNVYVEVINDMFKYIYMCYVLWYVINGEFKW